MGQTLAESPVEAGFCEDLGYQPIRTGVPELQDALAFVLPKEQSIQHRLDASGAEVFLRFFLVLCALWVFRCFFTSKVPCF